MCVCIHTDEKVIAGTHFPRLARQWENDHGKGAYENTHGTCGSDSDALHQDACTTWVWPTALRSADLCESEADCAVLAAVRRRGQPSDGRGAELFLE